MGKVAILVSNRADLGLATVVVQHCPAPHNNVIQRPLKTPSFCHRPGRVACHQPENQQMLPQC